MNNSLQAVRANGVSSLVPFTPLNQLDGMDWQIGVVLDESIIMAQANRLTW